MELLDEYKSSSSSTSSSTHHKKRAGRKIFRETRHPIYRGGRRKSADKWVCEVREPNKKSRIWLGTFPDPEAAAVAHDVAALGLRGDNAPLNFPDSATRLPRAKSASHQDIQTAAVQATRVFKPSLMKSNFSSSIRASGNKKKRNHVVKKALASKPKILELDTSKKNKGIFEICNNNVVEVLQLHDDHGTKRDLERSCNDSDNVNIVGFVDEEELFNMPVLIDGMAEGMLLTPPAMKKGFSWSNEVVEDDDEFALTLWGEL